MRRSAACLRGGFVVRLFTSHESHERCVGLLEGDCGHTRHFSHTVKIKDITAYFAFNTHKAPPVVHTLSLHLPLECHKNHFPP